MARCFAGACLLLVFLLCRHDPVFSQSPPEASAYQALEKAKEAYEKKLAQIEEQAEKERAKAKDKIKKEYAEVIAKARKRNDQAAADAYDNELKALTGEGEGRAAAERPAMTPGKPFSLLSLEPLNRQGVCETKRDWEKQVPSVNGRLTQEPFLYAPAPSTSDWPIPTGARFFKAHAYVFDHIHGASDCVMEIRVDGRTVARSAPLHNGNRTVPVIASIPAGAKTLTLISDPNRGEGDPDICAWVEPYFTSR